MKKERIFIIDDEESVRKILSILLEKEGYEVKSFENPDEALSFAKEDPPTLVLADLRLPGVVSGLDILTSLKEIDPQILVIIMTAYASLESAVEALRRGAFDYVMKPFQMEEIKLVVRRAIESRRLREENIELRRRVRQYEFKEIVGKNEEFQKILALVKKVASTDSTVLIQGESGTGKELIARAIHEVSPRMERPFIAVSLAALPEDLLESELFGHLKGSFTGAMRDKDGLFKAAGGGSLFLDEISEAPPKIQVKILRALQDKEITPVGATKLLKVDVRIMAATNANLEDRVKEGRFREDLFYRLNVVSLHLPPLRTRKDDIPMLVNHFLKKFSALNRLPLKRFSKEAFDLLLEYHWPGNVRELENAVERAMVISEGEVIGVGDLPEKIYRPESFAKKLQDLEKGITLDQLEERYILQVLKETGWNKSRSAEILGIDPSTLYRKLQKYGIKSAANRELGQ